MESYNDVCFFVGMQQLVRDQMVCFCFVGEETLQAQYDKPFSSRYNLTLLVILKKNPLLMLINFLHRHIVFDAI